MTKTELSSALATAHKGFYDYLDTLSKNEYEFAVAGKWSAGQQLGHILNSVKPLGMLRWLPKFLISYKFGKANRPSRSYDEIVAKYNAKLNDTQNAALLANNPFGVAEQPFEGKEKLMKSVKGAVETFQKGLNRFSENELDTYILPHPLLGRITLREMAYFTAYHVQHHQKLTLAYLKQNK